jgi:hypothetical protein
MKSPAWRLVGFDANETELEGRKTPIPTHIRERFLLRPEIELPYSVDGHVWPSVWTMNDQSQDNEHGVWRNLARMKQRLAETGRTAILVAVELLVPSNIPVGAELLVPSNMPAVGFPYPLIDLPPEPPAVPKGSVCLGFDVADAGFTSGLSDCGYSEAQLAELRPKWHDRINDFGLLKSEQDALEFKELSDLRVPEHAPFWVYRLSRLPDV